MARTPSEWSRVAQPPTALAQILRARGHAIAQESLTTKSRGKRSSARFAPPKFLRDAATARLEAALFWADEPMSPSRIQKLTGLPDTGEVRRQVQKLAALLRKEGSAFYVEEIAGGYQLLTRPDLRPWLDRICHVQLDTPLSGPMLETLAIVAYRQPICRADIEAIRGVQVGEILRHLLERGLLRLAGKEESLGRPFLYATTKRFLQTFGLRNLHELPMVESLALSPALTDSV